MSSLTADQIAYVMEVRKARQELLRQKKALLWEVEKLDEQLRKITYKKIADEMGVSRRAVYWVTKSYES